MKILAFEFSSPQRSVAIVDRSGAPESWIEHEAVETGSDSNKPFELIETVLSQAALEREQIDSIVIGLGPGSYTGIRAAIALAQGWQLGRAVKLQGCSSAECLAAQAYHQGLRRHVAVVIDAQRGEFYLANYELEASTWREVQPLRLVSESTVAECEARGEVVLGPEVRNWFPKGQVMFPSAATLGKLALSRTSYLSGEHLEPIYLRKPSFVKAPPARVLPD